MSQAVDLQPGPGSARHATALPWRRQAAFLIALVLVGAAIGLISAATSKGDLLYREASGSEQAIYFLARSLDGPRSGEVAAPTSAPLYALVLSWFDLLEGNAERARTLQLVIFGALIPLLAALAAGRSFGWTAALPAGGLSLGLAPFWIHAAWLSPSVWQAALGLLIVTLLASPPDSSTTARGGIGESVRAFVAGLLIGVARLFGAAWAPFLAVTWLVICLSRRRPLPGLAVVLGSCLLFVAPALRGPNRTELSLPPLFDGGLEMALGFHDGASGIEPRRAEKGPWRWTTTREMTIDVEYQAGRRMTMEETSRAWYGRSLAWIASHPLEALKLIIKKAWYLLSGYDPPSPESLALRARHAIPWARFLLYPVAALVGLGLAGLLSAARKPGRREPADQEDGSRPDVLPVSALVIATLLCGVLFYVRSGDRLALLLALTAPAAWALFHLATRRDILLAGALFTAVAFVPWLTLAPRAESRAEDSYLLAGTLDRLSRTAETMSELEKTLRLDPTHVAARLSLAGALARDGLYDQAIEELQRIVEAEPQFGFGWRLLALLHQKTNRFEESAEAYRTLIGIEPLNAEFHNNLGTIYVALNRYDEAVASLKKAVEIEPNYRTARTNLAEVERRGPEGMAGASLNLGPGSTGGSALQQGIASAMQRLQSGDVAGAEQKLNELRAMFGTSPELDFASGTVALQKGDLQTAIQLYERSYSRLRDNPILLNNLGTAYAQAGRLQEALVVWEQALAIDPTNEMTRKNLEQLRARLQTP